MLIAAVLTAFAIGSAAAQTRVETVKLPRPAGVATAAQRGIVIADDAIAADRERIRQPLLATSVAVPNTVLIRDPDPTAAIRAVSVQREFDLDEIRATTSLPMGSATLDLSALLRHPGALTNVAARLQANPAAVRVEAVDIRAYEVPQGLIVRSFLNYRLKAGTCGDPGRRASVERAGVACPRQQSESARIADYSNPASERFVAEPGLRARAIASARTEWARQDADSAARVAAFRANLGNPVERAKVVAQVGDSEVRWLESLDDAALIGELVATAETKIEDVMFIPRADKVDRMQVREMADTYRRDLLEKVNPKKVVNQPIDKVIFLTGFTLGRQYEWGKRIEKTIKWCWVGCAETYYAGARVAFTYGFGLRFPVELSGKYKMESSGSRAWLTADFRPIDGSPAQYLSAGLPSEKLFSGQEFVAEVGASAGVEFKLPVVGSWSKPIGPYGWNLAKELPDPYKDGQFTPPNAGERDGGFEYPFDQIDLLMGYGNWGVAGVTVHPAVKVQLESDSLRFSVHDNVAGSDQEMVSGTRLPLAVDPVQLASSFSIGAPVYNLSFVVTPGVTARVFIDVGVWGDRWDFPVWFPDLAIELPPGGIDFACHEGTICRRDYFYTAEGHTDLVGPGGEAMSEAMSWARNFQLDWTGACATDACRARIPELRAAADEQIRTAIQEGRFAAIEGLKRDAETGARGVAYGSQDAVVAEAVAAAKPRCTDDRCPAILDTMGAEAVGEMNALRAARVLPWPEAEPIAVTRLADRIRVELMNSKLRAMSQLRPDIPVMPQPGVEPPEVTAPAPPPPEAPVITRPLPEVRKLDTPVRRP
jgi:hypothetical protein